ncbi:hypothetical protein Tco_0679694 [Tanacetum coccineum]|uniref:Uncharacterized protein n=1 Tax=Tanacetum coccineum TaxID=301880 RepID=A0ABQ4XIJ0_9ASTR
MRCVSCVRESLQIILAIKSPWSPIFDSQPLIEFLASEGFWIAKLDICPCGRWGFDCEGFGVVWGVNEEDTAYLYLHFTRNHEELKSNTPYPEDYIRRIEDYLKILEDIEHGPYSKKPPIRRRYGVSVLALHKRPRRNIDQYAVSRRILYTVFELWNVNILEDIKRGPYSKKPSIRRRDTWYYSLGVSSIVDAFVRSEFGISSWCGSRVDGRSYLLSGAIDDSEANRIICDSKSCKVRVGSNGNLLWEASVLLGRKKGCVMDTLKFTAMPFGVTNAPAVFMELMSWVVTKGREDVREVFQQRGSGAKRKLSRCRRNQIGNEPILALPEGADDFVVLYEDSWLTVVRLTNRWLSMKKDIASCSSKYLACAEMEVEYKGSSGFYLMLSLRGASCRFEVVVFANCSLWVSKVISSLIRNVEYVEIKVDNTLLYYQKPLMLYGTEISSIKGSVMVLVKVRRDSKRGPELTWERKDQMRSKCPQLFVDSANASSS